MMGVFLDYTDQQGVVDDLVLPEELSILSDYVHHFKPILRI